MSNDYHDILIHLSVQVILPDPQLIYHQADF